MLSKFVFRYYFGQIERDVRNGTISAGEADDLREKILSMNGLANLQAVLYGFTIISRMGGLRFWWKSLIGNLIIEGGAAADRSGMAKHLHAPGIIILRAVPFLVPVMGNLVALKMEPRLYAVALRLSEHACRRMKVAWLIPVYVRPAMRTIRWVCELDWGRP